MPDALDFFLWAWTPYRPMSVAALYDRLSTRAFTQDGLWLNLGYWKDATTIEEACPALADLVARTASLGPTDEVVDAGFGFADQDILWAQRYAPRRVTGLNITASQVRIARQRVRRRNLDHVIDLREGSATAMELPDACCDVVTAVECAFHFDTRAAFLAEAFRVLRPGGRWRRTLPIRSAAPLNPLRRRMHDSVWRRFAAKFNVPEANADRIDTYTDKLSAAGFADVSVSSIRGPRFSGWHRALGSDAALLRRLPLAGRVPYRLLRRLDTETVYGAFDYVLAFARKPA